MVAEICDNADEIGMGSKGKELSGIIKLKIWLHGSFGLKMGMVLMFINLV